MENFNFFPSTVLIYCWICGFLLNGLQIYLKISLITFVRACGDNRYFAFTDMNYFLCVQPFLAAVDSDIMGISSDQVILLPPPKDQTQFCLNVSTCQSSFPKTMRKWNVFYQVPFYICNLFS